MNEYAEEISALVRQARDLEFGPTRVALLEEAIRIADSHNDVKAGYDARIELTEAATFSGRPDLLLVAFGWCLGQFDRDPSRFNENDLLWRYKWVIGAAWDMLTISRTQIEGLFDDLARRFERAGASMQTVYQLQRKLGMWYGDLVMADAAQARLATAAGGKLSDCVACVTNCDADYFVMKGQYEAAVARALPLVSGAKGCTVIPHITYADLLDPLFRLGRFSQAMEYHRRGYPMVAGKAGLLGSAADHMKFLTLTDNVTAARRSFERHLPLALRTVRCGARFSWERAGVFFLRRIAGRKFRLRVPDEVPFRSTDGTVSPAELLPWLESRLTELAAAMDRRNGNSYRSNLVAEIRELEAIVRPYPVRGGSPDEPIGAK